MSQQSYKICPQCQQPAGLQSPACLRCGHSFRTQFAAPENRTQAVYAPILQTQSVYSAPTIDKPETRINLIATMWGLTAAATVFWIFSPIVSFLLDIPAIVLAIILVCGKATADKVNGWIKLGLEMVAILFIAIIVAFAIGMVAKQPQNSEPAFTMPEERQQPRTFRYITPTERQRIPPVPGTY